MRRKLRARLRTRLLQSNLLRSYMLWSELLRTMLFAALLSELWLFFSRQQTETYFEAY
jgi:hypothetical protein